MAQVLLKRVTWRTVTLIACELLLLVTAVAVAAYIRIALIGGAPFALAAVLPLALLIALVVQVCLYYTDLYDLRILNDRRELTVRLLQAVGSAALVLALLYYWLPHLVIGRGVFLIASALILGVTAGWRYVFGWLSVAAAPAERLLLVGTSAASVELARELYERKRELGVEIVGFVDVEAEHVGAPVLNPGVIGTVADIPSLVHAHDVDRVVVSLLDARGKLDMQALLDMKLNDGVRFDHLASVYEEYTGKIAVENLRPSWLIFSSGFRSGRLLLTAKRLADVLLAALALVLLTPVLLAVAAAVKLSSAGPVLYRQARVGQQGKVFTLQKFRSMREHAEASTGAVWAQPGDKRVTSVGRFLRSTRLDELPQLWNVLVGEMSLVGPRPERPEFVADLTRQIPFYGQRHVLKPGLTGWAQVRYAYGWSVADAMEKLQYDLFYIKHLSLALDLYILLETTKTVFLRRGS